MTEQAVDFSMLLASSVHDIKNSLAMLLQSLDEIIDEQGLDHPQNNNNFSILRGEASRINNALIHLLGLYRLQNQQLHVDFEEIFIADFLEEQVASQQLLFDINKINVSIDCDDALTGYFDENLVTGIISNILVNDAKYTRNQITLRAFKNTLSELEIHIEDNGQGYPEAIINNQDNGPGGIDFNTGSTSLGLYFAKQIAELHSCNGRTGQITLANSDTGGGLFVLTLP